MRPLTRSASKYTFKDGVRHAAYQIGRHLNVVNLLQMPAYLTIDHPASVHRDNLIVEQRDALFVLRHYYRLERPGTVAGDGDRRALIFKEHRFFSVPVATVPAVVTSVGVFLVPKVFGHLRLQRSPEYPPGQLLD